MENRKTFTYNGVNSADYGLYISGDSVYNAPSRVYEMVDIAGRNGQLAIDQGRFENIEVTYPAFIFAETQTEFAQRLRDIRAWLMSPVGYQRLEDTYHPDEFRLGIYKSGLEVEPIFYNKAGRFELIFDCKPQRFLFSGEETFVLGEWGETETITGNIVTFEGTDTTAIKSVVAQIVPIQEGSGDPSPTNVRPISGWDEVKTSRVGKNWLAPWISDSTLNGVTYKANTDGTFTTSGTATASSQKVSGRFKLPVGRYRISGCPSGGNNSTYFMRALVYSGNTIIDSSTDIGHGQDVVIEDASYEVLVFTSIANGQTVEATWKPQIELGSTATDYTPYQGESYSIPFKDSQGNPITVYGGEIDVVRGEGEDDTEAYSFDGTETIGMETQGGHNRFYSFNRFANVTASTYRCSHFAPSTSPIGGNTTDNAMCSYGKTIYWRADAYTTVEAMKTYFAEQNANGTPVTLVSKVTTPTPIYCEPTEINTLDGINNIWADSGEVSVEYGADPNILVNPTPFEALPIFEVVGTGSLTVGNTTINITGDSTQDIFIDSDIMEAYEDDNGAIISRNDRINLSGTDFPKLGEETRVESNGLTSVKITPRWWTI